MSESGPSFDAALTAHRAKDFVRAEKLYRSVLDVEPHHSESRYLLSTLCAQLDREAEAVEMLEGLVTDEPENFEALSLLAGVLCTLGRNDDAISAANRALNLQADHVPTMLHLATGYFASAEFEEAAKTFMKVIATSPRALPAYYGLATTFLRLGDPHQAKLVLRDASQVSPDSDTLLKLGEVCLACELPEEALEVVRTITQRDPKDLNAALLEARAQRLAQHEAEEDRAIARALRLAPASALAHTLRGRRLQAMGKFKEAEEEFLKSIELNPAQGVAYYGITAGRKLRQGDEALIESMETIAVDARLTEDERAHLHYGLGKAYEDLGEYGRAMSHYDQGNRLMRGLRMGSRRFDREEMRKQVKRIAQTFTEELFNQIQAPPTRSVEPVIIAGIMRSGTTLLEQILSRHPQIGAGGEQSFWRRVEPECVDYEDRLVDFKRLEGAGHEYAALLASVCPGYRNVTEKNPANRMVYGLIHLAFPQARILHMQRNPADVAISIYTTMIRTGAPFMGDKDDIVFALKLHKELTRIWIEVLPETTLKIVRYEDLVAERERVTREIIEFLGLPWSEACLFPEENSRTVVTPSLWQVRQPVYSSAIERWRRYEPWLGSFAELLAE